MFEEIVGVPLDLIDLLEQTWGVICAAFDVTASLPDMRMLFDGADLSTPTQASEMVVANMLSEVIECEGRFSPWYKKPARAFGLIWVRDKTTGCPSWVLAPEAIQQWQGLLRPLAASIQKNIGLILATSLVDELSETARLDDPYAIAGCSCVPSRLILVSRSVLNKTAVICDSCQQPFHLIEETPGVNE